MKPIPSAKWLAMSDKKKSWIVARTLGEKANIYWHCVAPDGTKHGGSMTRKAQCDSMIETARSLTKKSAAKVPCEFPHPFAACTALPCTAFAHYAVYDHVAMRLIPDIIRDFGKIEITYLTPHFVGASAGGIAVESTSLQYALCFLFLKLHNAISD
jgi:hypothetical protein